MDDKMVPGQFQFSQLPLLRFGSSLSVRTVSIKPLFLWSGTLSGVCLEPGERGPVVANSSPWLKSQLSFDNDAAFTTNCVFSGWV